MVHGLQDARLALDASAVHPGQLLRRIDVAATADLERGLMGGKGKPEEGKLLPGDAEGDWEDE